MKMSNPSRRDDLISLVYVLFTMLNSMIMPGQGDLSIDSAEDSGLSIVDKFIKIKSFKITFSLFQLSKRLDEFEFLKDNKSPCALSILYNLGQFAKEIEELKFEDVPNYARLKSYL